MKKWASSPCAISASSYFFNSMPGLLFAIHRIWRGIGYLAKRQVKGTPAATGSALLQVVLCGQCRQVSAKAEL